MIVCTVPPEFCKYARKNIGECKAWLEETHPDLFQQIYGSAEENKEEPKELTEEEKLRQE